MSDIGFASVGQAGDGTLVAATADPVNAVYADGEKEIWADDSPAQ